MRHSLPVVVRVIALFEAVKGLLALLAGIALLSLSQHNAQAVAEQFVRFCHFDPASRYPRIFLDAVSSVTTGDLWLLASIAFFYALIRACEAYWLWNTHPWAEWFALGSTCFYLPVEIYELTQHTTPLMFGVLLVNVAIVAYLANALRHGAAWTYFTLGARVAPARARITSSNLA